MAEGSVYVNSRAQYNAWAGTNPINWASGTIKIGITTDAVTPSVDDTDPRWGSGGDQDYSADEVTPGGNYPAGGVSLSTPSIAFSAPDSIFSAVSPAINIASNPSNPTNARWAHFYDDADAGKHIFMFMDIQDSANTPSLQRSLVSGLIAAIDGYSSGAHVLAVGTIP